MPIAQVEPVYDPAVRSLCRQAYPGHPKGCPNWNRRPSCPPHARLLIEVLDLSRPIYCAWNKFDLGAHAERMRAKHPEWSDRQVYCCLYWQGKARNQLGELIRDFLKDRPPLFVLRCPEANGVNVSETMEALGVHFEWPPRKWAYQVALLGTLKQGSAGAAGDDVLELMKMRSGKGDAR